MKMFRHINGGAFYEEDLMSKVCENTIIDELFGEVIGRVDECGPRFADESKLDKEF